MTAFRTLDDVDVANKRVLVRVDLNVPMDNGVVTDATRIEPQTVVEAMQARQLRYDRQADEHYQTASAFIKSIRGSDPDGAVFWLAMAPRA